MNKKLLLVFVIFSVLASGCYFNEDVGTNEVAVKLYKNQIETIADKPGGVYSAATCFYCDLRKVGIDTLTFSVEDPEVLTKDNQAVSVKVTIQARRKADSESIKNLLTNWSILVDNNQLIATISATAREGMKNGTRGYTLAELLDDRNGLAGDIMQQLEDDAEKYSVDIVNVTIENIGPSAEYMAILSQTANLKAQTDQEIRRQDLINQQSKNAQLEQQQRVLVAKEQVKAEQAETEVQVEIASREGEVVAARNLVYSDNPQAFELKRLEWLAKILGEKSVFYLPADTDLTLFLQQLSGQAVPVPQSNNP